jgi:hypothetical protein
VSVRAVSGETVTSLGGEPAVKPGEPNGKPKLPPTPPPEAFERVPDEVRAAWIEYMVNGFAQNEEMFKRTLSAYMRPYQLTLWMYGALFTVGLGLVVTAVVTGLMGDGTAVPIAFAGLGAGAFLMFFIRQPTQALEENLEFITWLGVIFNTYWTRLMYIQTVETVQADLKQANDDFIKDIRQLIDKHARFRGKRPGAAITDEPNR